MVNSRVPFDALFGGATPPGTQIAPSPQPGAPGQEGSPDESMMDLVMTLMQDPAFAAAIMQRMAEMQGQGPGAAPMPPPPGAGMPMPIPPAPSRSAGPPPRRGGSFAAKEAELRGSR